MDTSALITILDSADPNHEVARTAWAELVASREPMVTSSYVVVETVSLLQSRYGLQAVRWFQDEMLPVFEVEWVNKAMHDKAVSTVLAGSRRGPSLVDCVGFELVRSRPVSGVFAYDKHFENRGFDLVGQA